MVSRIDAMGRSPAVVLALPLVLVGGCASPGVPRPPSLHLPAPVRDLSALRKGGLVDLHFTAPDQTTDHLPLTRKGVPLALTAVVCRVQGAACLSIATIPVTPGQAVSATDTLPPPLTIGPGRAVAYRVRVQSPAGRDAGLSHEAPAAAGAAPPDVAGLAATTVAQGMQLTWTALPDEHARVRIEATTEAAGTVAPASPGKKPARPASPFRLLQVPDGSRDPGGAIDAAPMVGARVRYLAYRERVVTVDGQELPLRGGSASVTVTRAADVFAPAAPLGLLAVSFSTEGAGPAVSLSWEANREEDVQGYYVYRADEAGAFHRITPKPVAGVSFNDTAKTGVPDAGRVRYAVSAVDREGNESGRSAATEVEVH